MSSSPKPGVGASFVNGRCTDRYPAPRPQRWIGAIGWLMLAACGGGSVEPSDATPSMGQPPSMLSLTYTGAAVSLTARSAPLAKVLELLAERTQLEISGDLSGDSITLTLDEVSLEQALASILRGRSYVLELTEDADQPGALRVLPPGRVSASELAVALASPSVAERVTAVYNADGPHAAEGLALAMNDESLAVRLQAVEALQTLDEARDSTMTLLQLALSDPEPDVRLAAVDLLPDLRAEKSIPALRTALNDSELTVREEAVFALAGFKTSEATSALRLALNDPDPGIRQVAAVLLKAPGRQ